MRDRGQTAETSKDNQQKAIHQSYQGFKDTLSPSIQLLGINIIISMASKATEILQNLNSQVKHPTTEDNSSNLLPSDKPPTHQKNESPPNKTLSVIAEASNHKDALHKSPAFKAQIKQQQSQEAPEFLVQLLTNQIGTEITSSVSQMVEQVMKQRQKNTYQIITGDPNNYIQAMLESSKKKNQTNLNLINNLMDRRSLKIEDELQTGHLEVVPPEKNISTKKQLEFMAKLDLARMIKIKEGELRSKMDILHQKMSNLEAAESWNGVSQEEQQIGQEVRKKYLQNIDAGAYSLDSQKTKIAKDYVRYMNQQRKLFQKRKQQRQSRYASYEKQRQQELGQAMQMKDLAKRQEILQRIEQRRKKRDEQQQQLKAKEQSIQQFLSEYHKKHPIFKQKQKQFIERYVKPQQQLRQQKLKQIRQNRKSMSLNDIKHHEEKYLSKRQQEEIKRKEQFKLIMQSRQSEDKTKLYYKGQAHQRMDQITKEEQKRTESLRQASKLKAQRMRDYSQVIHSKHKPSIDEEKKQQLLNFIEAEFMRKKRAKKMYKQIIDQATQEVKLIPYYEPLPSKDYKSQGKKYFIQAKKLAKKKQQVQSERMEAEEQLHSSREDHKISLLKGKEENQTKRKDIWQVRAKQLSEIAGSEIIDAKNFEYVKSNIQNLDKKAAQKQDLMKQVDLPMEQHIKEKGMLDQYYLQSIKQKMKLLE